MQKLDTLFISGIKKDINKLKNILDLECQLSAQVLIDKLQCPDIDQKLSNFDFKFKDPVQQADGTTSYEIEAIDNQKCYDRWNEDEQLNFIQLFHIYGQKWIKISTGLNKERTQKHCRTHGQKYIQSLNKLAASIKEYLNQHNQSQNKEVQSESTDQQSFESNSLKQKSKKDLCSSTKQLTKLIRKYENIRTKLLDMYRKDDTEFDRSLFPEYMVQQPSSNQKNQGSSQNNQAGKLNQCVDLSDKTQQLSSNCVNSEYISQVKNIQEAITNELQLHEKIQKQLKESKKKRTKNSGTKIPQSENQEVSSAKSDKTKKREQKRERKQAK